MAFFGPQAGAITQRVQTVVPTCTVRSVRCGVYGAELSPIIAGNDVPELLPGLSCYWWDKLCFVCAHQY